MGFKSKWQQKYPNLRKKEKRKRAVIDFLPPDRGSAIVFALASCACRLGFSLGGTEEGWGEAPLRRVPAFAAPGSFGSKWPCWMASFCGGRRTCWCLAAQGVGKTHLLAALGHELVQQGQSVYFTTCVLLVQRLLQAKQTLGLEKELRRLDKYEALIIDDLGYVQQNREEMIVNKWQES